MFSILAWYFVPLATVASFGAVRTRAGTRWRRLRRCELRESRARAGSGPPGLPARTDPAGLALAGNRGTDKTEEGNVSLKSNCSGRLNVSYHLLHWWWPTSWVNCCNNSILYLLS